MKPHGELISSKILFVVSHLFGQWCWTFSSYSKAKLKSHLENKQIKVTIKLDFETLIKEVNTNADVFQKKVLFYCRKNRISTLQNS